MERVEDTYAEAFEMKYTRLIVTAFNRRWLQIAANEFCGYGTSVIDCDAEAGIERWVDESETPDMREGVALLVFGFSTDALTKAVARRAGQCLMTCPTTAVFNGVPIRDDQKRISLGKNLRFFGDGFQKSKKLGDRRYWRVPVMDGEFVVEDEVGVEKGIAGGNLIIQSTEQESCLQAAERAVQKIATLPGCITPFPGGIARSGSKVGSRYDGQIASTSESFCPTLKGRVESKLHPEAVIAYEVVIDAINERVTRQAMKLGIEAALSGERQEHIVRVSAGNYGGKLGKCLVQLRSLF